MVLIRVLGPVEADVDGSLVPLGGPRQRAVLARLVSARGEVVSVDRLIDDLWGGEPPAQAVTSLQAYVSNLRRLLEPGRPPRAPARILVSAAPGYAIALPPDAVDAWRFERLLTQARQAATAPAAARALLRDGLSLWRGAAFAEVADEPWAEADVARLDELRRQAEEALVTVTLRAGEAAAAVPAADLLTRREPLREEGWRLLALALWASNRQGEALDTLRRARRTLADALGLDPGPELTALEEAILRQHRDVLTAALRPPASPPAAPVPQPRRRGSRQGAEIFVGRHDELAILLGAADEAADRGCARVALVSGEPGAGKSALLARLQQEIEDRGWLVIGGQCPEADGAPPAWAWVQALRSLAEVAPPPAGLAGLLEPLLSEPVAREATAGPPMTGGAMTGGAGDTAGDGAGDVSAGRFRLHRAVRAWLIAAARDHRLAIVLDDVHRADAETLALLAMAGTELTEVPILLLAGYRAAESSLGLAAALAALAARSPVRVQLTGLSEPAVAELVDAVCQQPASPAAVTALAERTGGNPFYVRESARLLDSEGALVALSEVPEGVRDVLRRRLGRLPEASVVVLRLAALAGREADIGVLVEAADSDEAGVLDALEAGLIAGLLTEPAAGQVRFVHALVRDALVADLSQLRSARMHARLGAAIERLRPDSLSALAYHYGRAASAATAVQAVDYSVRAAERAERRYAHDAAVGLLTQALDSSERIPADQRGPGGADRDAQRVALLRRLPAAQLRAGAVAAARVTRQQAIDIAEAAGRTDLLIAAFTGWTEPTPWQTRPYGTVDQPVVAQLARLLELPGLEAAVRCRLLEAFTAELAGEGDPRSLAAATQAVKLTGELTGELADPALRALALTALARDRNSDAHWPQRGQTAAELITLGTDHDLPAYRSYGYFTAAIAAAADGDVRAVARLLEEGLDLARAYRLPEAEGIGCYGQAMLAHIAGDLEAAERRYTETTARLLRHGSLHAGRFQVLAVATLRVGQGRVAEYAAGAQQLLDAQGPHLADLLTVALAENGQHEQARRMHARAIALRPDFLFSTFAALRAMALIAVGDRAAAAGLYQDLLPLRGQLPGALSLSLAMRPVAHILGDLAVFLGRPQEAAGHFGHAVTVAERWHAPRWAAEARAARQAIR